MQKRVLSDHFNLESRNTQDNRPPARRLDGVALRLSISSPLLIPRTDLQPRALRWNEEVVRPTAPIYHNSHIDADVSISHERNDCQVLDSVAHSSLDTITADLRAAEDVLRQRHERLKQPHAAEKKRSSAAIANDTKRKPHRPSMTKSYLTSIHPSLNPSVEVTAADSLNHTLQRRRLIKDLAYRASSDDPHAISVLGRLNIHFEMIARCPDMPDLILSFLGRRFGASQLGSFEHIWLARYNAIVNLTKQVERRQLGCNDYEFILQRLFPNGSTKSMSLDYFEVFVDGLAEEGIITHDEAKEIGRLMVTAGELEHGIHYSISMNRTCKHGHDPPKVRIFDIPQVFASSMDISTGRPKDSTRKDLHRYLRMLVEATVYRREFWKGYFFANASSKFDDFYQAYKLSSEGSLLPPNLSVCKRPWCYNDVRLLQRGCMLCRLLDMFEKGRLEDFGIIRVLRGTYVHMPGQSYLSHGNIESFLYHRVVDSGLPATMIPEIVALHPDNDDAFLSTHLRCVIAEQLHDRLELFQKEEKERLQQLKASKMNLKMAQKAQMTMCERVKTRFSRAFGRKAEKEVTAFDPFTQDGVKNLGCL